MKAAIVGIRNSGYLIWNKLWNRIIYTRDVLKFDERKMYAEVEMCGEEAVKGPGSSVDNVTIEDHFEENTNFLDLDMKNEERFCFYMAAFETVIDEEQIRHSGDFKSAVMKELAAIDKAETWELVPRSENKKVFSSRWVFTEKSAGERRILKARLVVRGFERANEMEEIRAPVAKLSTFRIFITMCCQNGFQMR